jgi:hypothetical protein
MIARSLLIAEYDSKSPATSVVIPAMMASVQEVEVVVAHSKPVTLPVGDMFLETDADQRRTYVEAEAMAPARPRRSCGRKLPVLAPAALPGRHWATSASHLPRRRRRGPRRVPPCGRCTTRRCHHGPARSPGQLASRLDSECEWLIANDVLPAGLVTRNRQLAEAALRPRTPVFIHGDLRVDHVFVDDDQVTGVAD